jgi:hypothetical protein
MSGYSPGDRSRASAGLLAGLSIWVAVAAGDRTFGDETAGPPEAAAAEASKALDECAQYPLNVGREWSFWAGPLELIERVARHEKVGDELCARIETEFNGKIVSFEHVAVRADGIYRVAVAGRPIEPPLRFLKLPVQAGDTWKIDSSIAGEPIKGDFKTSEAKLKIGDDEFSTVVVAGRNFKAANATLSFTYYFAPGIGKVRQVIVVNDMETTLEMKAIPVQDEPAPRLSGR